MPLFDALLRQLTQIDLTGFLSISFTGWICP